MAQPSQKLILVTGATGFIASRLIPRLLEEGYRVRCLVRKPRVLKGRAWFHRVEVVAGEVMEPASLVRALQGVWSAYYLVHNMSKGRGYTEVEREGARNFARAAEQQRVEHIIYLGGLADPNAPIASHLKSRIETGEALRSGSVPVTEFRAGVIVGPGSISFEMIRFLTELFPILPCPVWMQNFSQPIAVQNVLDYLLAALHIPSGRGRIFEIGGPDVMRYVDLPLEYARIRGLSRRAIILPYIPLWFTSFGVGLTSPVRAAIAHALIGGLRNDSRVLEPSAQSVFPEVHLIPYEEAVGMSLAALHPNTLEPMWKDFEVPSINMKHEGFFINHRTLHIAAPPEKVFGVLCQLGRDGNWLYANWLWRVRAWLDSFLHKKPPSPPAGPVPAIGDARGFYRVETIEPGQRLLLHAELAAPGDGWMEWRIEPEESDRTRLTQTGFFAPRGLLGFLYWYLLYPAHQLVFHGLIHAIAQKAEGRLR